MLRRHSLVALAALVFVPSLAAAQGELPRPSPYAKVVQHVGLTKISLRYSRPAVRKRRIWGKLVPYGKLWRTGANKCTLLKLDKPVTIGGKAVPAGKYSVLTIPGRRSWTVIINRNTQLWGTRGYKAEDDVARFTVRPRRAPYRERLTFLFSDVKDGSARLDLWWKRLYLPISIKVDTRKQALKSVSATERGGHRVFARAATYLLREGIQLDRALALVERTLKIKADWYSLFIKAKILHKKKQHKAAYATLREAKSLGDKSKRFFYRDQVNAALKRWKRR